MFKTPVTLSSSLPGLSRARLAVALALAAPALAGCYVVPVGPEGHAYVVPALHQGAGTCTFSNGARYQVHIGS